MSYKTRKHLSLYAVATISVVMVFALSFDTTKNTEFYPGSPQYLESQEKQSMQETVESIKLDVNIPVSLPSNLAFDRSYVDESGTMATIFFSNESKEIEYYIQQSNFDPKTLITHPVKPVTITVEENGEVVSVSQHSQTGDISSLKIVKSNGMEAVYAENADHGESRLAWNDNGIFYAISGDLTEKELVQIWESSH